MVVIKGIDKDKGIDKEMVLIVELVKGKGIDKEWY